MHRKLRLSCANFPALRAKQCERASLVVGIELVKTRQDAPTADALMVVLAMMLVEGCLVRAIEVAANL